MRKFIKYIFLSISVLGMSSCETAFLDNPSYTDLTTDGYYQTLDEYENALIGCYYYICGRGTTKEGTYAVGMPVVGEAGTDECYINYSKGASWEWATQLDSYTQLNPNNNGLQEIWQNAYKSINNANMIITRIAAMSEEELEATPRYKEIRAEASFLNALWYFNLVRIFGGVPLRTEPSNADEDFNKIDRSTIQEVYAYIEEMLDYAKQNLPDNNAGRYGTSYKMSAYGLSAKVNLHIASSMNLLTIPEEVKLGGINSYDWTLERKTKEETIIHYYTAARDDARVVLDHFAPDYLMPEFTDCFYPNESSAEILFEGVMSTGLSVEQGGWFGSLFGPKGKSANGGGQHVIYHMGSPVLDNFTMTTSGAAASPEYSSLDGRFMWTISTYSLAAGGVASPIKTAQAYKQTEIGKFRIDAPAPYNQDRTPVNNPILRVSDICLVHSEAQAELDNFAGRGITDEALEFLNVVRARADVPLYDKTTILQTLTYSQKAKHGNREMKGYTPTTDIEFFRRAILNERMLELLGEGHRWFDLVRMGLLTSVVPAAAEYASNTGTTSKNITNPAKQVQSFHIFRPIPSREISIQGNYLVQNYGYN